MMKWICGSLPISRWLCLLELSNPARWGSPLRSLSDYFAFIRRLRVLHYWLFSIFLLIFSLVFGIRPVQAQDTTPVPDTPTPTNEPLIKTATPMPTLNTNCNGYQPSGWGAVTPNAFWLQNCGQCVTSTPYYQWPETTPYPWETLQPTKTQLPTLTPTPFLGSEIVRINFNNAANTVINPASAETDYQVTDYNVFNYLAWPQPQITFVSQRLNTSTKVGFMGVVKGILNNRTGYNETVDFCFRNLSAGNIKVKSSGVGQEFEQTIPVSNDWVCKQIVNCSSGCSFEKTVIYDLEISRTDQPTFTDFEGQFRFGNAGTNSDLYSTLFYWKDGGMSTPIVIDGGFCSSVNGGQEALNPEDIFGLPQIEVGWARCFQIGGWTIPLEWAQVIWESAPDSWTLPGIEFCFKPLTFGNMSILGLKIDLDFIAAAMAAVLLFRFLTRS